MFYCALDWVEDGEVARDVVSDVFSELWGRYDDLNGNITSGYLVHAVRNRCLNYLKHKTVEDDYRHFVLSYKEKAIDENFGLHEERLQMIDAVMEALTAQTRDIFQLCYYEGKTYAEVATIVGLSSSAVHKHVSKALTAFRGASSGKKVKKW